MINIFYHLKALFFTKRYFYSVIFLIFAAQNKRKSVMEKKPIRDIIERHIAEAGMTKRAFAEAIGRTAGSLNDLLSSPSWPSLEKMASVLGISVAQLVSDADCPHGSRQQVCPHCGRPLTIKIE